MANYPQQNRAKQAAEGQAYQGESLEGLSFPMPLSTERIILSTLSTAPLEYVDN